MNLLTRKDIDGYVRRALRENDFDVYGVRIGTNENSVRIQADVKPRKVIEEDVVKYRDSVSEILAQEIQELLPICIELNTLELNLVQ